MSEANIGPEIETVHWMGQVRYRCPLQWESGAKCLYDSGTVEGLKDHMRSPHSFSGGPPAKEQPRSSAIVDASGKPYELAEDPRFSDICFKKPDE